MKTKNIVGLFLSIVLSVGIAQAAPKKSSSAQTNEAAKASETILKKIEGRIDWTGYGVGKSHSGTINIKSGEIVLGDKDAPQQIKFIVDMKSLDTPDSDKLKGHLKSADFFEVDKYPEATFKSTSATINPGPKDGVAVYTVKGDLKIKDKTAPIEFVVNVTKKDGKFSAHANAEIMDRTKFGIVYHSKKFETASKLGDKLIEDNIKINISVIAQK